MLTLLTILTILSCDLGVVSNGSDLSSKGKDGSFNKTSSQTQEELKSASEKEGINKSWKDIEDEFSWMEDNISNDYKNKDSKERDTEPSSSPSSWGF